MLPLFTVVLLSSDSIGDSHVRGKVELGISLLYKNSAEIYFFFPLGKEFCISILLFSTHLQQQHILQGFFFFSFLALVTLSIQLENVTSRTIQFNWKPQGGRRDSPYRVRLWDGSRELENRNLNETSTAFEGLLSDHEYQISVDVLTCSKNVSTSMIVRTGISLEIFPFFSLAH